MASPIWVLAENWRGQITETALEVLALGREVAAAHGSPLEAVLLGHNVRSLAGALGAADNVLCADQASLAEPSPEAIAWALTQLVKDRRPQAVLVPWTNLSMDAGALAAAQLGVPFVNGCKDLKSEGGTLVAQCVVYGGKLEAAVAATTSPALFGVLPGSRSADAARVEKSPSVTDVTVNLPEPKVKFQRYLEPEAGDVDITQQDVLVAVGRGIQSQDNLELAEELARLLGGAVCGSRPVIDQGWLPLSRQVGKSGMQVKPKLYLMLGISGAPEHVEGIKGAQLIVAINTDANAPVFNVAHLGINADLFEVVPVLTEKIRAAKGGG
ncbi:MAG: electron transfer flavoprotein subunit alpha/FixB family protein [Verrucomicrobiae bacterium]|nr:electron transfer flavoprotein subunit alpha/FixB family protein [Verrucomicrobiae bacterium]